MGKDRIFEDLGETISKTAKVISEKADDFLEIQKVNSKISAQKREIDRALEKLGTLVYQRHVDGEPMDLELGEVCEEVTRHKMLKAQYEERLAQLRGKKICPACGRPLEKDAAYCSSCGAPCGQEKPARDTQENPGEAQVQEAEYAQEEPEGTDSGKTGEE